MALDASEGGLGQSRTKGDDPHAVLTAWVGRFPVGFGAAVGSVGHVGEVAELAGEEFAAIGDDGGGGFGARFGGHVVLKA